MTALALTPEDLWPDAELVLPAGASRAHWLNARKLGVGGSDVAPLKGVTTYGTAYQVWCDKTGRGVEKLQTKRMRRGQLFEAGIAQEFAEDTGIPVIAGGMLLRSRAYPHLLGTPDFFTADGGGLEIKFVASYGQQKKIQAEGITENYWWQIVTYLAVTGLPFWRLAVCFPNVDQLHIYTVSRESVAETIAQLGPFVEQWWSTHVGFDIPPDDGGAYLDDVQAENVIEDAVEALLPDQLLADEQRLAEIKAAKDQLEAEAVEIRQKWFAEIGRHKFLTAYGRRVVQRVNGRTGGRFNVKGLAAKYPKIADEFAGVSHPNPHIKFLTQEEAS